MAEPDLVALWLGGLDGLTWWEQDADATAYSASLMKLPIAQAAERLHQRGELDLDAEVLVHDDFDSVVAGERYVLDRDDDQDDATWDGRGTRTTLRELRRRALVLSGNLATNVLLEHVGLAEVAAVLRDAGSSDATQVVRGIDDAPAQRAGISNVVTARDLGRLLAHTPPKVEQVLLGQHYRDAIPAGLLPELPAGTTIANKTGWIDDHTHDMAIVRPGPDPAGGGHEPFVLVVLTRLAGVSYDDANRRIADLAAQAWERRR
ncbi:serine hydrolase [Nocardioides sp.]|uniref:serine hydrolase n=1 Tax=Nocardioides sp. TaxID=35761 RepID=UPI002B2752AD|nr:serine hydrolase [Nocardioides sp.]